ncbi:MAG: hypothetical protein PWR04_627 [Anaerophaga sp.]|nr:hypothetical protein [Anaerophaga sp.]
MHKMARTVLRGRKLPGWASENRKNIWMKRAWQGLSQKNMYKPQSCEFHQTNNLD